MTVRVEAKALPLRTLAPLGTLTGLAQRDCKKCFLHKHCDYILYAICTEFEKGKSRLDKGGQK